MYRELLIIPKNLYHFVQYGLALSLGHCLSKFLGTHFSKSRVTDWWVNSGEKYQYELRRQNAQLPRLWQRLRLYGG